jgi:hypothetical protein
MAATYLGQTVAGAPSFDEDLDGGVAGSFRAVWKSDAAGPDDRIAEIITASESSPYNITLGATFPNPPFDRSVVTGRRINLVSSDDMNTFEVVYTLGATRKKTIAATSDWVFTFSSSLSGGQTNIDKNGDFITVGTLTSDEEPTPTSGPPYTAVPKTGAQVEKMFPSVRISARGVLAANPFNSFQDLVGKLNSSAMTVDGQTLAIGTTMLVNANVQSPDDGGRYIVNYEFEYRKDPLDWYAVVVAIDPKTGKPYQGIEGTEYNAPASVTKGTISVPSGSVGYAMYDEANLQGLITV